MGFSKSVSIIALVAGLIALCLAPAQAADVKAGKSRASQCAVCHGRDGVATNPEAPNLAGEASIYIERQLKAFRSGERKHEQMSIIAQSLTDADIADLAAWYAAMKVTVELPKIE